MTDVSDVLKITLQKTIFRKNFREDILATQMKSIM